MGKSYFLAIETWSLQNKGKAEFASSLYRQISAPGCSHYLTDTEILEALWVMSHVPVGVSLSPSTGRGQPASPLGGCTVILSIWINCSSPRLITQLNQFQFSWEHPATLIKETYSPARIYLPAPSCFYCADVKNKDAVTVYCLLEEIRFLYSRIEEWAG